MKKNLLCLITMFALFMSATFVQAQAKKVVYITANREFAATAADVMNDPIIKLLQADENFEVTVMAVAMDSVISNIGDFDVAVVQESFYSTAAILQPTGSAALSAISIPFIYTKMWALKTGRALESGGHNGGAEAAGVTLTVDASNQSDELFNGITFTDNKFDMFKETASGTGEDGDVALNYADGIELSRKNTLLATCDEITETDSTIFLNDFKAGSKIGSETLKARMIAIGANFGAVIKDGGDNFTQNGLTLWRNAIYSLAGLTVPTTPVEIVNEEEDFEINIDFGSSSNNTTDEGWNNIYLETDESQKVELISAAGDSLGIMAYFNDVMVGINNGGTTEPDETVDMPSTATMDNLYCNGTDPTAGLTFTNFDVNYKYNFYVFASRIGATDNREGKYTVTGQSSVVGTLNPSDNDSAFAVIEGIIPDAEGKITMEIEKGDNHEEVYYYVYLGAIRITRELLTATNDFASVADEIKVYPVPFQNNLILSNMPVQSTVSVYSITGTKVLETISNDSKISLSTANLVSGIYLLRVTNAGTVVGTYKVIKR